MEVTHLRAYLAEKQLTMKQFCKLIDRNEVYIAAVIRGSRQCGYKTARDIEAATDGIIKIEHNPRRKKDTRGPYYMRYTEYEKNV